MEYDATQVKNKNTIAKIQAALGADKPSQMHRASDSMSGA